MSPTADDRIEALESTLAYQEQQIETLNEVVTDQARKIEQLTRQLARLTDRLLVLEETKGEAPPIDKPPHW